MSQPCPKCGNRSPEWVTLRRTVPVDVQRCASCGYHILEEDWVAPLPPFRPGRCMNCGDARNRDVCVACGLTRDEDFQVHDELRGIVNPALSFLDAAREAARVGRRLLALKLATASLAREQEDPEVARGLRVWLLSAIGESNYALEDAKAWVETSPDPSALAWATLGQQLQHGGYPGGAADAYAKSLAINPGQSAIRAKRAALLVGMSREGQAAKEAMQVFEDAAPPEAAVTIAIEVAEKLCDDLESRLRDDEIQRMLDAVGRFVDRSAKLLGHKARLAAMAGDTTGAKRLLKKARRIEPELPIYARVEGAIKPHRQSWWRW